MIKMFCKRSPFWYFKGIQEAKNLTFDGVIFAW